MRRRFLYLIAIAAVAILIVAGVLIARRISWSKPKVQAQRYLHKHLPSSEWEPAARFTDASRTLRQGETLANIARLRYGHQHYSDIIKLYNHIAEAVPVGTSLRVPDISTILTEEGFARVAGPEMEMILCSRAKYDKIVDQLRAVKREPPLHQGAVTAVMPQTIKQELSEAADDLQQATESLKTNKPGTIRPPAKMIGQLESAMRGMRQLAEGRLDDYGYDIDLVQQRYALGLSNGIVWAREGFN